MSPAGAGTSVYRQRDFGLHILAAVFVVLVGLSVVVARVDRLRTYATSPPAMGPLSPAWSEFQADCESGPSPGQGSTSSACRCWEQQLEAEAIAPGYAVDALNAAQVGGGEAYVVPQNLAGGPMGWAMTGCGLYAQAASE